MHVQLGTLGICCWFFVLRELYQCVERECLPPGPRMPPRATYLLGETWKFVMPEKPEPSRACVQLRQICRNGAPNHFWIHTKTHAFASNTGYRSVPRVGHINTHGVHMPRAWAKGLTRTAACRGCSERGSWTVQCDSGACEKIRVPGSTVTTPDYRRSRTPVPL